MDGKIDPFIFFPLLPSSSPSVSPENRSVIRTGSTDLGPLLLFFCSLGRQREEDLRFAQSPRVSSSSSPSLSLLFLSLLSLSLFLLFAFLSVFPSPLLPISALFLVHLCLSNRYPVPSITFTSFYHPPVLCNGYVYTGCPVVQ